MADAFLELQNAPDAGELSREDWLGLLVDREATSRENKRLARRLREARLRQSALVEDVDFRGVERSGPANGKSASRVVNTGLKGGEQLILDQSKGRMRSVPCERQSARICRMISPALSETQR
jgi:DNA replication protein DnaC